MPLQVRGRVERSSDQAADELADLFVGHRLELVDGVDLRHLAEERRYQSWSWRARRLANLLVRIRANQLERRHRPLLQLPGAVELHAADRDLAQQKAQRIAAGELRQHLPELRCQLLAKRVERGILDRGQPIEEVRQLLEAIEIPIEQRDRAILDLLVARHDLVDARHELVNSVVVDSASKPLPMSSLTKRRARPSVADLKASKSDSSRAAGTRSGSSSR